MCYAQTPKAIMRFPAAITLALLVVTRSSPAQMASAMPAGPTVIHAATLLDGRGATTHNVYVIVRNGTIERMTTTPDNVPGAASIEIGSAT
jgi:hypothetical protein